jgi:hypothetical protein
LDLPKATSEAHFEAVRGCQGPVILPCGAILCYDRNRMKRKFFFLVIIVGLILIVAAITRFLNNRGPKQGELRVESIPVASIFLDNRNIGRTPYKEKVNVGE